MEPRVVPGPEDQQKVQNALYPPNQLAHLPDNPAAPQDNNNNILQGKVRQTIDRSSFQHISIHENER